MSENKINGYIDEEEKDLMESIDSLDLNNTPNPDVETNNMFKEAATAYLKQDAKMNIRINASELERIKEQASAEGLKYQSFVKSVLHKYLNGQLVEKSSL
jgi:predicted DNA binding CopG/RHH family protein